MLADIAPVLQMFSYRTLQEVEKRKKVEEAYKHMSKERTKPIHVFGGPDFEVRTQCETKCGKIEKRRNLILKCVKIPSIHCKRKQRQHGNSLRKRKEHCVIFVCAFASVCDL